MKIEYFEQNKITSLPTSDKYHIVLPAQSYATIAHMYNINETELRTKNNNEPLFIGKKMLL